MSHSKIKLGFSLLLISWLTMCVYQVSILDLNHDEPFTVYHAQFPASEIIQSNFDVNNPPLHTLLLHYWIKIFGITEVAVRSLSILFILISMLIIWYLPLSRGKLINTGVTLIVLTSNFSFHLLYEARPYALLFMLFLMSSNFIMRIRGTTTKNKVIYLYIIAFLNVLMFYTHYISVFIIGCNFLFLTYELFRDKKLLQHLMTSHLIALLAVIPLILSLYKRIGIVGSGDTWLNHTDSLGQFFDILKRWLNDSVAALLLVGLTLVYSVGRFVFSLKISLARKWMISAILLFIFVIIPVSYFMPLPIVWRLTIIPYFYLIYLVSTSVTLGWLVIRKLNYKFTYQEQYFLWLLGSLIIIFLMSFQIPLWLDRYLICFYPVLIITIFIFLKAFSADWLTKSLTLAVSIVLLLNFNPFITDHNDINHFNSVLKKEIYRDKPTYICPVYFKHTYAYHQSMTNFRNLNSLDAELEANKVYLNKPISQITFQNFDTVVLVYRDFSLEDSLAIYQSHRVLSSQHVDKNMRIISIGKK